MSADSRIPVNIRYATAADADTICRLHVDSIRAVCAPDYTPEQIEAWAGGKRPEHYCRALERGEVMWVAELSGCIVGFASIDGAEICALYISAQFLRSGIGTLLLQHAEQEFMTRGLAAVRLSSTLTAEPFYRAQGYQSVRMSHMRLGGTNIPCVEMVKTLRVPGGDGRAG